LAKTANWDLKEMIDTDLWFKDELKNKWFFNGPQELYVLY
jgi:hypothetical protein